MLRLLLLMPALCTSTHMPQWLKEKIKNADLSDNYDTCNSTLCEQPARAYTKMLPMQPGVQWMQHGGYCGAWSVQRAVLAKGAYISQQQVRDHAKFGGGHDEEILNTNIDGALERLKIKAEDFNFNALPTPQSDAYLRFMKKHLVADNPVIWMVMFGGDSYPDPGYTMDNQTNGVYGHIEPVVGIMSDNPLTDEAVHDDDIFAYFDDASKQTFYATASKVAGTCNFGDHKTCRASCPTGLFGMGQCVWKQRGYIYAIQDFADEHDAVPASLSISPFASEPYTRGGEQPIEITATLTAVGLKTGSKYDIYRWDSAEDAFVYNDANKIETFTASEETHIFEDPTKLLSNSATYYRVVPASSSSIVV
eukprot:TRINITY_DN108085_c0_g1_i1.p1 TRINITY_DN108085_c0_g1~~TRINITY_DN108085_c0_g1_i1.p1  ORF type:complete len:384 (+),score=50.81 TRINITY_DN108085_c0_g1_i1:61-1152(+)